MTFQRKLTSFSMRCHFNILRSPLPAFHTQTHGIGSDEMCVCVCEYGARTYWTRAHTIRLSLSHDQAQIGCYYFVSDSRTFAVRQCMRFVWIHIFGQSNNLQSAHRILLHPSRINVRSRVVQWQRRMLRWSINYIVIADRCCMQFDVVRWFGAKRLFSFSNGDWGVIHEWQKCVIYELIKFRLILFARKLRLQKYALWFCDRLR